MKKKSGAVANGHSNGNGKHAATTPNGGGGGKYTFTPQDLIEANRAAEPLNLAAFEPGPGFFRVHLLSGATLLSLVVFIVVYLVWPRVTVRLVGLSPLWFAAVAVGLLAAVYGHRYWRRYVPYEKRYPVAEAFERCVGVLCTVNFILFWALPIFLQGQSFKQGLHKVLRIPYRWLDESPTLRRFAAKYIYSQERYADFFATFLLIMVSVTVSLGTVFYWQLSYGALPWWLTYAYNFAWVGFGGRVMGAAYTFAHKEGHFRGLYAPWIRDSVGNICENWIGCFFGNVPYNFTASHTRIHHRLDAGMGDTFYMWDCDRSTWSDLMLFLYRIFVHCTGLSSLWHFQRTGDKLNYDRLLKGCLIYWFGAPLLILYITHSPSFLFWIYFQPFLCMTYFLAFMNYAFHGYIEFDKQGKHLRCINSTTIIEGQDDYFGEDDHMAHHYALTVYFKDLKEHQKMQLEEWKTHHASVFRGLSIVELAAFQLLKKWDLLAHHFVDFNEKKMPREELMRLLETRLKRKEMTHFEYERWLEEWLDGAPA